MHYSQNQEILKSFYAQKGLGAAFERDNTYLEEAFNEQGAFWQKNFDQIETIKYLMIAEAPLWGKGKNYVYNPDSKQSQFFYFSDLKGIAKKQIKDKASFIDVCNSLGLLIVDISPFAFNNHTAIQYGRLPKRDYQNLVKATIPVYFDPIIKSISAKKSKDTKVFFRYARVKNYFVDILSKVLLDHQIIKSVGDIGHISQMGGGIDKMKLKHIMLKGD